MSEAEVNRRWPMNSSSLVKATRRSGSLERVVRIAKACVVMAPPTHVIAARTWSDFRVR
jgi:hypothetical protein